MGDVDSEDLPAASAQRLLGETMFRPTVLRALVASALLIVAAAPAVDATSPLPCNDPSHHDGGDWTTMSGDLAGSRYQAEESTIGIANAASLEPAWAVEVSDGGSTGSLNSTPTIARGCVVVASANGDVVALDADTGEERWSTHIDVVAPGLGGAIVSAVVVEGSSAITLVNESGDGVRGPYAIALDVHDGSVRWTSAPFDTYPASYTNGSPVVIPSAGGSVVFAGWSPPEGDSLGQGGFVLLDTETGDLVEKTFTIPIEDQVDGDGDGLPDNAGGGIWAPPSYDEATGFAYVGAGNTFSKTTEHPRTNSIIKIDLGDRSSATFGEIVGAAKGNPDQYLDALTGLKDTPACDASDVPGFAWPLDDPVCGQLDLDFGAPVNLFDVGGRTVVAGLQKAGVVHAFWADTMAPLWQSTVGTPCAPCNAAATAIGPDGLGGVSSPGGVAFTLDAATGELSWATPIANGPHYQGVSLANGVFYTFDNGGTLSVLDAASGAVLTRRPVSLDTEQPTAAFSSSGIAIARNTVFVAASTVSDAVQSGWVIAYRAT
jgi:outer membrane protein assembly factor BamB